MYFKPQNFKLDALQDIQGSRIDKVSFKNCWYLRSYSKLSATGSTTCQCLSHSSGCQLTKNKGVAQVVQVGVVYKYTGMTKLTLSVVHLPCGCYKYFQNVLFVKMASEIRKKANMCKRVDHSSTMHGI